MAKHRYSRKRGGRKGKNKQTSKKMRGGLGREDEDQLRALGFTEAEIGELIRTYSELFTIDELQQLVADGRIQEIRNNLREIEEIDVDEPRIIFPILDDDFEVPGAEEIEAKPEREAEIEAEIEKKARETDNESRVASGGKRRKSRKSRKTRKTRKTRKNKKRR